MNRILRVLLWVSFLAGGCGPGVPLPVPLSPEPEVTQAISIPPPSTLPARLTLTFGAGELILAPGAADALVEGTATYNYSALQPTLQTEGERIRLQAGQGALTGFPPLSNLVHIWDLRLAQGVPLDLTIEAGAYQGHFELGGLALTGLAIQDGAARVQLSFSEPNPAELAIFRYQTGASRISIAGLGWANFGTLIFQGGAGDYTLDFSGQQRRSGVVTVDAGLCNLILIIPEGVPSVVTVESNLTNVHAGPTWSQNNNTYIQRGDGPALTFLINIGAGNLTLTR